MSKKQRANKQFNNKQVIDFKEAKSEAFAYKRKSEVNIIPKNTAQEEYVDHLTDYEKRITFAIGSAGTGKTMLAVLRAVKALKDNEISRIVITRPAVSVDEQHGFLPGDLNEKMAPWTRPIFDILEEYWSPIEIAAMLEERTLEIAPLAYMRGRTFKRCYIVADEMQNSTPEQMKMLLTRLGSGTYLSITGDGSQHDRGYEANGIADFLNRVGEDMPRSMSKVEFTKQHCERDYIVEDVLDFYDDE